MPDHLPAPPPAGLAAWPGSFREFDGNGSFYNNTEGHYGNSGEPVFLSGTGMSMYIGVFLSIVAMMVEAGLQYIDAWRAKASKSRDSVGGDFGSRGMDPDPLLGDAAFRQNDLPAPPPPAPPPSRSQSGQYSGGSGGHDLVGGTGAGDGHPTAGDYFGGDYFGDGSGGGDGGDGDFFGATTRHERFKQLVRPPLPTWINAAAVAVLALATVCVVEFVFPAHDGEAGLGMPWWVVLFTILYSFLCAFGVSMVYATTGQTFSGGVCILLQVLAGLVVPGSARANIVAVMLCNTIVSQAMTLLSDFKTALYLQVNPRSMFLGQLLGAGIGVFASAATFLFVLDLSDRGDITLGSAEWPAVGAVSQTLNAKLFGEQGPGAIFHGTFLYILVGCAVVGAVGPVLIWLVPDRPPYSRWKPWLPSPVLLGTGALYGGINFMCMSMLVVGLVYQWLLKTRHRRWYDRFQHVSTSGVNAGVGLSGLLIVLFTILQLPTVTVGPQPTPGTCTAANLSLPAKTDADVACYNLQTGCNTPWPST